MKRRERPKIERRETLENVNETCILDNMTNEQYHAQKNWASCSQISREIAGEYLGTVATSKEFGIECHELAEKIVKDHLLNPQDAPIETKLTGQNKQKFLNARDTLISYFQAIKIQSAQAEVSYFAAWEILPKTQYFQEIKNKFPHCLGIKCRADMIRQSGASQIITDWKIWTAKSVQEVKSEWYRYGGHRQRHIYETVVRAVTQKETVMVFIVVPKTLITNAPFVYISRSREECNNMKNYEIEYPIYWAKQQKTRDGKMVSLAL